MPQNVISPTLSSFEEASTVDVDDDAALPTVMLLLLSAVLSSIIPFSSSSWSTVSSADWINDCKSCADWHIRKLDRVVVKMSLPLLSKRRCERIPDSRWATSEFVDAERCIVLDKAVMEVLLCMVMAIMFLFDVRECMGSNNEISLLPDRRDQSTWIKIKAVDLKICAWQRTERVL